MRNAMAHQRFKNAAYPKTIISACDSSADSRPVRFSTAYTPKETNPAISTDYPLGA